MSRHGHVLGPLRAAGHASDSPTRHRPVIQWQRPGGGRYAAPQRINAYPYRWQFAGLWAEIPPVTVPEGSPMDANSFVILAAVVTLFSFNLTASLMCCRSLGRRVDRLEHRFDRLEDRMDRFEQRMDRFEQVLTQLVVDMALVKAHLGIAAPPLAFAGQPATTSPSASAPPPAVDPPAVSAPPPATAQAPTASSGAEPQ